MALNKFMHKRNIYRTKKVDFKYLGLKYPEFNKFLNEDCAGKVTLDFKDCAALRALTVTLLKDDFNLDVELPLDRLIPTVTLRLNYLHWIEDIIGTKEAAKGLDIGTGSCCIYPLLGCRLNNWSFLASEVDQTNATFATDNVDRNGLSGCIRVLRVSGKDVLLEALSQSDDSYDFCVCNPPFFADHLEAQAVTSSRSSERPDSKSSNCAHPVESIVEGGEALFVRRMVTESLQASHRVRIFTSMVGKKASLPLIKSYLHQCKVPSFGVTEFCQGRTMRWGIGWSFSPTNFPKSEFREMKQEKAPLVHELPKVMAKVEYKMATVCDFIAKLLSESLNMPFTLVERGDNSTMWRLRPVERTWTNQRRKRRLQQRSGHANAIATDICPRNARDTEGSGLKCESGAVECTRDNRESDDGTSVMVDTVSEVDSLDSAVQHSLNRAKQSGTMTTYGSENGSRTNERVSDSNLIRPTAEGSRNIGSDRTDAEHDVHLDPAAVDKCVGQGTNVGATGGCLFECTLKLMARDEKLNIEMEWIEGSDRNSMYQLMQFFKNQLV